MGNAVLGWLQSALMGAHALPRDSQGCCSTSSEHGGDVLKAALHRKKMNDVSLSVEIPVARVTDILETHGF